jgi:hypothetical protein
VRLDALWVVCVRDDSHQQAHDEDVDHSHVQAQHGLAPHCQERVVIAVKLLKAAKGRQMESAYLSTSSERHALAEHNAGVLTAGVAGQRWE